MTEEIILTARHVSMQFPGTKALDSVDFNVYRGKVNVIIGENGAGKSTLMNILAGIQEPSGGEIQLEGHPVHFHSTREAARHGIGMVHQELNLSENLSVADNIFLGRELQHHLMPIHRSEQEQLSAKLLKRLKQDIDPKERVGNLKVGQKQLVEIAKALAEEVDIIILDEPTSALSRSEVDILFSVIRELNEHGVSIIYISHRLEEIMEIGDYITILCDGKLRAVAEVKDISVPWIVRQMLGSEPVKNFLPEERHFGETALKVEQLLCVNSAGLPVVDNVSFSLRAGEIVGIYGLMGAGRTELFECLLGQDVYRGKIWLGGEELSPNKSTSYRMSHGLSLVPEDRKCSGVFPITPVAQNLTVASVQKLLRRGGWMVNEDAEHSAIDHVIGDLSIKVSDPHVEIQALSGGNQQKVIIGRFLLTEPKVLLLDEPTRGIDVGAKADIFRIMVTLSEAGMAVLFSTSDLKEIMAVSDRILVMSAGQVTADVKRSEASEEMLVAASAKGLK